MPHRRRYRIVIVGAGFSGSATAIQLVRLGTHVPLEVTLLERQAEFGRGTAYARGNYPYLLNVPAARMSADPDDPGAFLRYAQARNPGVTGDDYLPRALFGDYLQSLLDEAASRAHGPARLERLRGEAIDLRVDAATRRVAVDLADGARIEADVAVIASGFQPLRLPPSIRCGIAAPLLRPGPWSEGRVLGAGGRLLVIGTGLTMVDVVSEAVARHPDVEIHAISRHGLLAPAQTTFRPEALVDDGGILDHAAGSVRRLFAAARELAASAEHQGGDWREAVTLVRRRLPVLWGGLTLRERRRFLRHAVSYWDIHRHRLPPGVHRRLAELRASGQLTLHAGRVLALDRHGDAVAAVWRPRGRAREEVLVAGEVVGCTGPDYDLAHARDPLWRSLQHQGLAVADPAGLGVRTGEGGALLAASGETSFPIYYVGPMLRGDHWEVTAVSELRTHAQAVATRLLQLADAATPVR